MIDFPKGWRTDRIGNIFEIKQGKSLSRQKQTGNKRRKFLRTANVFWGRLELSNLDEMSFTDDECLMLALKKDDLLVCEGGDIGRTAIWNGAVEDCYYQNHLHRLRRLTDEVVPHFVMYWMQSALTQLNIYGGAANKTTIPNLSRSRLAEFVIPLPPLPEQKKIAAILFKIQRAIETQDKIIQSLRDLKQSTMQHLFTHGLRGEKTRMTEIGEIPESWELTKFGDFATLHRGYDLPVQARTKGEVPVVGSNGIVGYHREAKVNGPGVVTGRSGSIGISYYVEEDYWPLNTGLYVSDFHGNLPLYVHYFFEWFNFNQYAAGVSVPTLNRNLVHAVMIAVPSEPVQNMIADTLSIVDNDLKLTISKKSALQALFKTMLNKLITGKIRVKDWDMDVSEIECKTTFKRGVH
jgi:type I restriction enzyme S subunit